MFVTSSGIQDGFFADKYGKRGISTKYGMPTFSFGFSIADIPAGTISFAFILDDPFKTANRD